MNLGQSPAPLRATNGQRRELAERAATSVPWCGSWLGAVRASTSSTVARRPGEEPTTRGASRTLADETRRKGGGGSVPSRDGGDAGAPARYGFTYTQPVNPAALNMRNTAVIWAPEKVRKVKKSLAQAGWVSYPND